MNGIWSLAFKLRTFGSEGNVCLGVLRNIAPKNHLAKFVCNSFTFPNFSISKKMGIQ